MLTLSKTEAGSLKKIEINVFKDWIVKKHINIFKAHLSLDMLILKL